jgi:nucleotide-binding universal stress UspA family protein
LGVLSSGPTGAKHRRRPVIIIQLKGGDDMTQQLNRLLLAIDGSDMSSTVVDYAGAVFPKENTELVLYHVKSDIPESFWDIGKKPEFQARLSSIRSWSAEQQKTTDAFLEQARLSLMSAGFSDDAVTIKVQHKKSGVSRDILKEASGNYTAVVLGRTGISRLKDVILGSTAIRLIGKLLNTPLIVVGNTAPNGRVLIGYDGSAGAENAVRTVGRLALSPTVHVTVCHVIRTLGIYQIGPTPYAFPIDAAEWDEARRADIEPELNAAGKSLVKAGFSEKQVEVKTVVGESSRAAGLVQEANMGGYDTIAVGRRGITGLEDYFAGRVSKKVFQMAGQKTVWIVS